MDRPDHVRLAPRGRVAGRVLQGRGGQGGDVDAERLRPRPAGTPAPPRSGRSGSATAGGPGRRRSAPTAARRRARRPAVGPGPNATRRRPRRLPSPRPCGRPRPGWRPGPARRVRRTRPSAPARASAAACRRGSARSRPAVRSVRSPSSSRSRAARWGGANVVPIASLSGPRRSLAVTTTPSDGTSCRGSGSTQPVQEVRRVGGVDHAGPVGLGPHRHPARDPVAHGARPVRDHHVVDRLDPAVEGPVDVVDGAGPQQREQRLEPEVAQHLRRRRAGSGRGRGRRHRRRPGRAPVVTTSTCSSACPAHLDRLDAGVRRAASRPARAPPRARPSAATARRTRPGSRPSRS